MDHILVPAEQRSFHGVADFPVELGAQEKLGAGQRQRMHAKCHAYRNPDDLYLSHHSGQLTIHGRQEHVNRDSCRHFPRGILYPERARGILQRHADRSMKIMICGGDPVGEGAQT